LRYCKFIIARTVRAGAKAYRDVLFATLVLVSSNPRVASWMQKAVIGA